MSRYAVLVVLLPMVAPVTSLAGQEPDSLPEPEPSPIIISEKSPMGAAALELFLPTAGYGYAGDWSRGIPSALMRITGSVLILEQQFTIFGEPPPCEGTCVLGVVLGLGGTLWGTIDAAATARRTNERQREAALSRLSVGPVRGPEGTAVRIGMTLPVSW